MENAVIGHPTARMTFSQILLAAKREEQELAEQHEAQARAARAAAAQARTNKIQELKSKMDGLLVTYESQRNALRSTFHELYELEQTLTVVSAGQVQHLPPQLPMSSLPSAFPAPTEPLYSPIPSFQQEIQTWQQTRVWPLKG